MAQKSRRINCKEENTDIIKLFKESLRAGSFTGCCILSTCKDFTTASSYIHIGHMLTHILPLLLLSPFEERAGEGKRGCD